MGFPIVIGSKSVSSRPVALPDPIEEFSVDDASRLLRPSLPSPQTVFTANDQVLQAVITLCYYDMLVSSEDDDERTALADHIIAELCVQISPTAEACSNVYRESRYRIALPTSASSSRSSSECHGRPTATFSADRRFLTCLIPHPISSSSSSMVVVFQLRRPKSVPHAILQPPLPPYILQTSITTATASGSTVVPVATNPRVLALQGADGSVEDPAWPTCVCDVATTPPMLVVGCQNGSLLAASYRPLGVAGLLHQGNNIPVLAVDHLAEWQHDPSSQNGSIGRLAAVFADGSVSIFRSHILVATATAEEEGDNDNEQPSPSLHLQQQGNPKRNVSIRSLRSAASSTLANQTDTTNTGILLINLTETHELGNSSTDADENVSSSAAAATATAVFCAAKWIAGSYLALAHAPPANAASSCTVQVYGLYDCGRSAPVSTLQVTWDSLQENAHTSFLVDNSSCSRGAQQQPPPLNGGAAAAVTAPDLLPLLEYDAVSDCIAVSSYLVTSYNGTLLSSSPSPRNYCTHPFVCVWSWRTDALGFTAVAASKSSGGAALACAMSRLSFAVDDLGRRRLAHTIVFGGHGRSSTRRRVRKELYDAALLSPPDDSSLRGARIRRSCSLLLSSSTVAYPQTAKSCPRENFELQWTESIIPKHYLTAFGSPTVAAIGGHCGRSIAVASSRGLCILDCESKDNSLLRSNSAISDGVRSDSASGQNSRLSKLLRAGHVHSRWHQFENELDEKSFRVVAMTWWEVPSYSGFDECPSNDQRTGDFLVAVIEIVDGSRDRGYYFSCWSSKMLGLRSQLLSSHLTKNDAATWGIRLPNDFCPESIDLLAFPSTSNLKACVLLADAKYSTAYRIYQLHVVSFDQKYFEVLSRCCATGSIGSPSDLFLASASFAFSLDREPRQSNSTDSYVATIGVVRRYGGGVDALAVSQSDVIAVGQVIESADIGAAEDTQASELSKYWLADIIRDKLVAENLRFDFFVWVLQFAEGSLLCWSVPMVRSSEQIHDLTRPGSSLIGAGAAHGSRAVHPKGISLGLICKAGTTSGWMQQSSKGTRTDFLVGCAPRSTFGCVMGVGQSCRKHHRSLCEDFEGVLFRTDFLDHEALCPSDFVLYPPACLASLYSLALEAVSDHLLVESEPSGFALHFMQRMNTSTLQNTTAMAAQLLVLRSVEEIAANSKHKRSDERTVDLHRVFASLVSTMRNCATPLQFATLFLKVARQLEPSYLPHLFPLPCHESESGDTVDKLFDASLAAGSINMSVAALPLLADGDETKKMSAAIFHCCLNELDGNFERTRSSYFDASKEVKDAAGDIFRYAMKVSDPGKNGGDAAEAPFDDSDDDGGVPDRGYSIVCGISNIFSRRTRNLRGSAKKAAADSYLVNISDSQISRLQRNGFRNIKRLSSWQDYGEETFETVAGVTARYILSSVFDGEALSNCGCWKKVGALASLVVGGSRTGLHVCSKAGFADLAETTEANWFRALIPSHVRRTGGLVKFISQCISGCTHEIGPTCASDIVDLILVLLGSAPSDVKPELPGLLLVALITAHVSDRILDVLADKPADNVLWTAYLEARDEQGRAQQQ